MKMKLMFEVETLSDTNLLQLSRFVSQFDAAGRKAVAAEMKKRGFQS
jgi:hypothetical protein